VTGFWVDFEGLRARSIEVGEAAEAVRGIEPAIARALTDTDLFASAVLSPVTALQAEQALVRAATNADGLGSVVGNPSILAFDGGASAMGIGGLAERIAADAILMRISALTYESPDLVQDGRMRELIELLEVGRTIAAGALLTSMLRHDENALGDIAPVFPELLALNALLDGNPHNDPVGWEILDGRIPSVDPITSLIDLQWLSEKFDRGPGHVVQVPAPTGLQTEGQPTLQDMLGNDGRIVVQTVVGPDGTERYIVQLPGMNGAQPYPLGHPQDVASAIHNAYVDQSPYTRAVKLAMEQAGVPRGAEVMLVGHSLGGITATNLAQDPGFNGDSYRVTDVVSVGSPVDNKTLPPGSGTNAISITNDRDIVPALDGQGAGSPHQSAGGRHEFEFSSGDLSFPASHDVLVYVDAVNGEYGATWGPQLNEQLARYTQGSVIETTTFRLSDHPPEK
jgi:hypothetical protein